MSLRACALVAGATLVLGCGASQQGHGQGALPPVYFSLEVDDMDLGPPGTGGWIRDQVVESLSAANPRFRVVSRAAVPPSTRFYGLDVFATDYDVEFLPGGWPKRLSCTLNVILHPADTLPPDPTSREDSLVWSLKPLLDLANTQERATVEPASDPIAAAKKCFVTVAHRMVMREVVPTVEEDLGRRP